MNYGNDCQGTRYLWMLLQLPITNIKITRCRLQPLIDSKVDESLPFQESMDPHDQWSITFDKFKFDSKSLK